ncbi:MAG: hypothetical protein ACRBCS_08120 [Cellvibrionaceae bacterium]
MHSPICKIGFPDIAIQKAQHASQHDPKNYLPMIALSGSYIIIESFDAAEGSMKEALRIHPQLSERQTTNLLGNDLGKKVFQLDYQQE